ncbi:MAG: TM2 domain-containing protein [Trichodesmium sp. St16_bin4-tuft]|nr:TM2 domain-containing protein [Trichodesmium sp. St4_bin8_1]MDE5072473.1 TM2 domain-containing protein [Trichodesmium sp. St5_bin8]MDE5092031.1 TM2 domain-containing protein [Trichodesmium sp. St18_bin3_1_1]MDE5099586.1 TM2 domain-containing protein [Trichodesmium sp. St16_bin4-tuft]
MKGIILAVSIQKGNGIISGDDGKRYRFLLSSWYAEQNPKQGLRVDFDTTPEGEALDIYQDISDISASPSSKLNSKNRGIAAILAFFLGAFGAHKFYLGYS